MLSNYLETFEIIRKPSRLSGSFPDHPDTFQTIQKLFRPAGNFPGHLKIFPAIWKLSRLFGNLQDYPETSQTARTLSRISGNFPDYPETFQTIRKLPSAISRVTFKNFPGGNATMPRWFLCLWNTVWRILSSKGVPLPLTTKEVPPPPIYWPEIRSHPDLEICLVTPWQISWSWGM